VSQSEWRGNGEATMAAKGFTAAQWLVIAFIALLAAVIVWEAGT
jgi:hypothetical protein